MAHIELEFSWIHLAYDEASSFVETYGFSGNQGMINLEGILIRPKGRPSSTLLVFMHPSSTLQLLPVPQEAARHGAHVLCAASRYARNDTAAIMEKVVLDLGAYLRYAKSVLEYDKIVLVGWSGGGSLALFYQSQAESPSITHTPAGDAVNLISAGLVPADAVIFQAAHISRARLLLDVLDPSVTDEVNPDRRDPSLDIYGANGNKPPYSREFMDRYREAQRARMNRITDGVKALLQRLKQAGGAEAERGFVTHRTLADPRFLDGSLDPNDRRIGWCYLGNPETANSGPAGLARFSTLRAWLSQWSIDDSRADALVCADLLKAPLLAIENTADDAVPQPHVRMVFDAASCADKEFVRIMGATHYYANQPVQLAEATDITLAWLRDRKLA